MADPTGGANPGDIFTYIGMGIGGIVAVVVAHLGWNSGGRATQNPDQMVEVKNAIIDSSSINRLTAAIEAYSMTAMTLSKRGIETDERLSESMNQITEELRNLSREVREMAREISTRRT